MEEILHHLRLLVSLSHSLQDLSCTIQRVVGLALGFLNHQSTSNSVSYGPWMPPLYFVIFPPRCCCLFGHLDCGFRSWSHPFGGHRRQGLLARVGIYMGILEKMASHLVPVSLRKKTWFSENRIVTFQIYSRFPLL